MTEASSVAPPAPAPRKPRFARPLAVAAGLAVIAALAWGGWRWATRDTQGLEDQYIIATVERGDIEDLVSATGSLQPRDYVDVGAQVSGQLKVIHVEVGSEVQKGDLLAEIDAEQSAARVEASRAQLRSQQAQLAERQMTLAKAERDLARQRRLMAEEGTTLETLQNAETAVRTAQAQIASLQAQMEQLQASMRVEEANLKYTRIYAPMAGTVVSITARQGQTLNANQQAPTLMRIADLSTMLVQTQVSEADVAKLRRGMQAYFTTLGSQGQRWWGQLKKIEPTPTVTNNVVLYNALFEVPNDNRRLMTQMTAQVFFVAAEAHDVLTVPMGALTLERRNRRGARGVASQPAGTAPAGAAGEGRGAGSAASATASPTARAAARDDAAPASTARRDQAAAPQARAAATAAPADPARDLPARDRPDAMAAAGDGAARASALRPWPRDGAGGPPPDGAGGPAEGRRPGMDRQAWADLPEEERERLRAERRARRQAGEAGGESSGSPNAGASVASGTSGTSDGPRGPRAGMAPDAGKAPRAQDEPARRTTPADRPDAASPHARREAGDTTAPAARAIGGGAPRPAAAGADAAAAPRNQPRKAKVRVIAADDTIVEREVTIGVSNRVHAEVLSGLKEGERVIAGNRPKPSEQRNAGQQQGLAQQGMGPMGPGPGGPGAPGGATAGGARGR